MHNNWVDWARVPGAPADTVDEAVAAADLFLEEGELVLRMTHMEKADAAWIEECVRELLPLAAAIEAG